MRVPKQASEVETKKLRAKALNEKSNVIKSLFANEMFRGDIEQLRVQKGEIQQAMNQQLEQQLQALTKPTRHFYGSQRPVPADGLSGKARRKRD